MNNLFTELENQNKQIPLAEILRPKTIEEFLGQSNVVTVFNNPLGHSGLRKNNACKTYRNKNQRKFY